ncbi:MAG: M20/M25/M40 family metallo-hydrolase [Bdellovibrionales bacterium]|nr:M20/M25/M40 family metallo-hydrolase [Bdellovibrionales bacterium]
MQNELAAVIQDDLAWGLDFLERIVRINTFTKHREGVNEVQSMLAEVLSDMDMDVERVLETEVGDQIIGRSSAPEEHSRILLMGHVDTVFPPDGGFTEFSRDSDCVFGPGVLDMKGGLVVVLLALRGLARLGRLESLPLTVFFNSDEEIASPCSRKTLARLAPELRLGLVFEGDRPGNALVTRRKGIADFSIRVTGKAAHSGSRHSDGKSAIRVAAALVEKIEALTDYQEGATANVGLIKGGSAINVVPETAVLHLEVRAERKEKLASLRAAVQAIVDGVQCDGVKVSCTELLGLEPLEETPASRELFEAYRAAAASIGHTVTLLGEAAGGGSDANNLAALGIPALDGLGVSGANLHTHQEYARIDSFVPKACAVAAYLLTQSS